MNKLENIQKIVNERLNDGVIVVDRGAFTFDYPARPTLKDVRKIEGLANAIKELAECLEGEGIPCDERLPTDGDADAHGNVEWRRSGIWMRGPANGEKPVDATHWRSILDSE